MQPIHILLSEHYSDWEIAPLCGLGRAFYGADLHYYSSNGGPVTSAAGLCISNTKIFDVPDSGVVVICGSGEFESNPQTKLSGALIDAYDRGCVIAGICGGTLPIADAGLLDGIDHTSNALDYLKSHAINYRGDAFYRNQPSAVRDVGIITAPAPAPASFASEILQAAGLDDTSALQIKHLLGLEHGV